MRKLLLIIQELIIVNCILGMIAFLSITVQAKGRVLDEPMAKEITGIENYGIENPSKPIIDEAWQGNYVYFGKRRFPVASFLKKRYTINSLENTRITGGLQHDRSNELWRCGNSSR